MISRPAAWPVLAGNASFPKLIREGQSQSKLDSKALLQRDQSELSPFDGWLSEERAPFESTPGTNLGKISSREA